MKHILLATDGSDASRKAVGPVAEFLEGFPDLRVTVLYVLPLVADQAFLAGAPGVPMVVEPPDDEASRVEAVKEEIVKQDLGKWADRVTFASEPGHAPQVICAYAQAHSADLIVIGSHGRTGLDRVLLGSVSHAVVSHAAMSVLIVK
jgi:nucleotide-binding universal stress UspA family protein